MFLSSSYEMLDAINHSQPLVSVNPGQISTAPSPDLSTTPIVSRGYIDKRPACSDSDRTAKRRRKNSANACPPSRRGNHRKVRKPAGGGHKCPAEPCPEVFLRQNDAQRHFRTTCDYGPHIRYICENCGKEFVRDDSLKRHLDSYVCQR